VVGLAERVAAHLDGTAALHKIWIAHHWVQPWQVLPTQLPWPGAEALALRGAKACVTGTLLALWWHSPWPASRRQRCWP
jgi:hypothetical protein